MVFWKHEQATIDAVMGLSVKSNDNPEGLIPEHLRKIVAYRLADMSVAIDKDQHNNWKHCERDPWVTRQLLFTELLTIRIPKAMKNIEQHNCFMNIYANTCYGGCVSESNQIYSQAEMEINQELNTGEWISCHESVVDKHIQSVTINKLCPNGYGPKDNGIGIMMHLIQDYHSILHNGEELRLANKTVIQRVEEVARTMFVSPQFSSFYILAALVYDNMPLAQHVVTEIALNESTTNAEIATRTFLAEMKAEPFIDVLEKDTLPFSPLLQRTLQERAGGQIEFVHGAVDTSQHFGQ